MLLRLAFLLVNHTEPTIVIVGPMALPLRDPAYNRRGRIFSDARFLKMGIFSRFFFKGPRDVHELVARLLEQRNAYLHANPGRDITGVYRTEAYLEIVQRLGYDHDQAAAVARLNGEYLLSDLAVAVYHLEMRAGTVAGRTKDKIEILNLFQRLAPEEISQNLAKEIELLRSVE